MNKTESSAAPMRPEDLEKIRELFAHSAEHLDVATANRLRLMRREALSADARGAVSWWWPTGILAASLLVATVAWWRPSLSGTPAALVAQATPVEDASLAVEDDADLYAWLGEGPVAVDPSTGESL